MSTKVRLRGSFAPGTGNDKRTELLVLLPSLGTTTAIWDSVVKCLRRDGATWPFRILLIDLPGHGASPPAEEPFTVADLAQAVLTTVDDVGGGTFHLAGVSFGGATALEVAIAAPERVLTLTMLNSGARIGTVKAWRERAAEVRNSGTASLVSGAAGRWFAPGFLERHQAVGGRTLDALVDVDDSSYAACAEALAKFDRTKAVADVHIPTLLLSGAHDLVTPPEAMQELASLFPRATHHSLAKAAHLAVLEQPEEVATLLLAHLTTHLGDDAFERGMAVRRAVLGDEHVDRAIAATTPDTAAFQDFITRVAWGDIWSRPGLDRRSRSVAVIASLIANGHHEELAMHLRAGRRNGLSVEEIREIILQSAIYSGVPAANTAFRIAAEVLAEETP